MRFEQLYEPQIEWNGYVADQLNTFPVYVQQDIRRQTIPRHQQPGIEIQIAHTSSSAFSLLQNKFPLQNRQVVIANGGIPHELHVDKQQHCHRTVICLDYAHLLAEPATRYGLYAPELLPGNQNCTFMLDDRGLRAAESIIERIQSEMESRQRDWNTLILMYVSELSILLRRQMERTTVHELVPHKLLDIDLVSRCVPYIASRLYEELSLQGVAAAFQVSAAHLSRSFKAKLGVTFPQYVLQCKMIEAKRLMQMAEPLPITDIAYLLGFSSASHFTKTFKQYTGQMPSAFRKR
ncbi:MAG: transcriptional regulator, AraC family [Paenibacillus sp.]|nr:transcriptional regulator, AraC family [Paenibacillus sp.]